SRDRVMLNFQSIGKRMADALLPPRLRRSLWANRKRIAAIQVLSENTSIPWELLFLSDPDDKEIEGEGFLAEYGLVRWLHDRPWPGRRLALRGDRVRYVVPSYPVANFQLPEAQRERDILVKMFPGASQIDAESVTVVSQLRRPGPIDVLHVSGHG